MRKLEQGGMQGSKGQLNTRNYKLILLQQSSAYSASSKLLTGHDQYQYPSTIHSKDSNMVDNDAVIVDEKLQTMTCGTNNGAL